MKMVKQGLTPIIGASLIASAGVYAQERPAGFALEEVVVTARKREESLQDTPIAVSAFTERELEVRQIEGTDRLGDITPNLTFDSAAPSSGSSSAAQIFIRGIGQSDFTPVTDPGVGLYIDGVYMARSVGGVMDFLDVERIEILRGPQGTLFGRNTIGGAISIHSKRPEPGNSGSIQVQVGDDDMRNLTAKGNVELSENVLTNFAIASRKRDGYVERVHGGGDLGDDDSLSGRFSMLWTPSDTVEVFMAADATKIRENGTPGVNGGVNEAAAFGWLGNALLASCSGININPNFPNAGPPALPWPPTAGGASAPGCVNADTFLGEHKSGGTFPTKSDLDIWGASVEVSWDATDWMSIKSITAYRDMDMDSARDGDSTPANVFATIDIYEQQQFSQELQFSGVALEDRLQWLFGLYYFAEKGINLNPVTLPVGAFQSGGNFDNSSEAAFFQATYDVTDRLAFTFGIRYTEDTKHFRADQFVLGDQSATGFFSGPTWPLLPDIYASSDNQFVPAGDRIVSNTKFKEEFDDTNIMLNLSYQWTDTFMVYGTYSEGYKSGGFDQRFTKAFTARPSSFEPETVESYEVGFKSDLFDNRVRLNVAAFYTDYDDLQIIIRESFNPITFNGGEADIFGAEAELTWVPTDRWYVTAAVGYVDAEYDKLDPRVVNNNTPVAKGNELVNTPELNASLGIAYTLDVGDWATLTPRVDWSYTDEQYNDAVNEPRLFQDSYDMLNASFHFETNDGRWESVLAFRNIADETYLITGNSAWGTAAGYVEQVYNRPFEWSWSVKYNFF
jgi:iron complex outermembrane receptor protein